MMFFPLTGKARKEYGDVEQGVFGVPVAVYWVRNYIPLFYAYPDQPEMCGGGILTFYVKCIRQHWKDRQECWTSSHQLSGGFTLIQEYY